MSPNPPTDRSIFLAAVDIASPVERAAYVARACGDNAQLRADVQALLAAHDQSGDLLDAPDQLSPTIDRPVAECPGTQIGPYKLMQQIGEGGMGVVYMAEQKEPVERRVALKIIKPGMDTRQVIARFEAERQALAMMDHPNIAKVLDAGTTESGRPYFVMELVKGQPITQYCDDHHLTPRQRLELLLPVCQAIQHAHQKGIIHRDIKPTNILVAEYDQQAVPKVIDFGVAKAVGSPLTEKTMFTGFGQIVGTLEYMSPEQAKVNQLDIDTRSDIYSLGVLLYELLTGSTPFDKNRLRSAAFDEMLRIIREEEPERPSTRLSSADTLPSIAANRGIEPARLSRTLRGELDWIVMKALEKDRNRRYETANGIALDLQRYLADEPVQACPPSAEYRLRKFARRNKAALAVASVVTVSLLFLLVGLAVSNLLISWERNEKVNALEAAKASEEKAKKQEQVALESAKNAKAQRVRAQNYFLRARLAMRDALMKALQGEDEWSEVPVPLRKQLAEDLLRFLHAFIDEASDEPSLRYETGWAYWSLAALHTSWGEDEKAQDFLRQSIVILDPLVEEYPAVHEYRMQLAASNLDLARQLAQTGRTRESETAFRRVIENYEKLLLEVPGSSNYRSYLSQCHQAMGQLLLSAGRTKEADVHSRQAVTLWEDSEGWAARGDILRAQEKLDEAISCYRKALELDSKNASALYRLGSALNKHGRVDEAIACHKKLIELDPKSASGHIGLGHALKAQGNIDQAIVCFRTAVALDPHRGNSHHDLGSLLRTSGKLDEAAACFKKAIDLDPNDPRPHAGLGHVLRHLGNEDEAIACYKKAISIDPKYAEAHYNLGISFRALGMVGEAIDSYQETIRLKPDHDQALRRLAWIYATWRDPKFRDTKQAVELARRAVNVSPKDGTCWITLGAAHYRTGDWKAAVEALNESMKQRNGGDSLDWFFLAMAHWQLGDKVQARKWYGQAVLWTEMNQPKNDELRRFREEAEELLEIKKK